MDENTQQQVYHADAFTKQTEDHNSQATSAHKATVRLVDKPLPEASEKQELDSDLDHQVIHTPSFIDSCEVTKQIEHIAIKANNYNLFAVGKNSR